MAACICCLAFLVPRAFGQSEIRGTVQAATSGKPLPGAAVHAVGTTAGVISDAEGAWVLQVPAGADSLRCTFTGYETVTVALASGKFDFRLDEVGVEVDDVVITALGIKREERALGYGYTQVDVEEATENRDANFLNTLSGKVAGLQVTKTNGGPGSSSRVLLRGIGSLRGSNQPLFVVDGVPVDNTTRGSGGTWGGVDFGSPIADINPDDIASMTVLKGPNAAALYGSRAAAGVIVITTKAGNRKKGIGVSVGSNTTIERAYIQRKFQNIYGAGNNGEFQFNQDSLPFFNTALEADSWGPRMEGQPYVDWDGEMRTFSPQPDNWKNYFETGYTTTNSISLNGGDADQGFRLSYTDLRNKGTSPNSFFTRNSLNFRGSTTVRERLRLDIKTNYIHHEAINRVNQSDGRGAGRNFHFMPRNISLASLLDYKDASGAEKVWYSPWSWQSNPYWRVFEDRNEDERDRVVGRVSGRLEVTDWLSVMLRSG
ncbi:MAG: TonB-dependent receptor plug domain-containing protein, partial [Bacteroidota bacterium]